MICKAFYRLSADTCLQQQVHHRHHEGLQSKRGYENSGGGRVQLGRKGERSRSLGERGVGEAENTTGAAAFKSGEDLRGQR